MVVGVKVALVVLLGSFNSLNFVFVTPNLPEYHSLFTINASDIFFDLHPKNGDYRLMNVIKLHMVTA